jgi:hypothetical protein
MKLLMELFSKKTALQVKLSCAKQAPMIPSPLATARGRSSRGRTVARPTVVCMNCIQTRSWWELGREMGGGEGTRGGMQLTHDVSVCPSKKPRGGATYHAFTSPRVHATAAADQISFSITTR